MRAALEKGQDVANSAQRGDWPGWRRWIEVAANILTVAIVVVAGVMFAAALLTEGQSGRPRLPVEPMSLDGAKIRGNANAPIAVIMFSDFGCEYCRHFALGVLPTMVQQHVDSGNVLLAFRHLPLERHFPVAMDAAIVAECAHQDDSFWEVHDSLFRAAEDDALAGVAAVVTSLRGSTLIQDCDTAKAIRAVVQDRERAGEIAVSATPTFVVGRLDSTGRVQATDLLTGSQSLVMFERLFAARAAVRSER
jgi:protein-disulfide isomerase